MQASHNLRAKFLELDKKIHTKWFFDLVTKYKYYLIITFMTLLSCSSLLVFYKPTLQPSDDDEIQLLSRKHAFEQYDKSLRRQFMFERIKLGEMVAHNPVAHLFEPLETLPVRIVFGIRAKDNGDHLDSQDRGTLEFEPSFDLADPKAQVWMLEFCRKLKLQRFVHLSQGPDLSNCFIETFKSWMEARSCRDPIQPDLDRNPCCQSQEFPYSRRTFYTCIGQALDLIRKTPQFNQNFNSGIRFFKNSSRVAAMIVEYQSNRIYSESFTKMERFFNDIDEWISWQINNTAPASLKSGWFISNNLELLALQTELEQSTSNSILIELVFAMIALMTGTRNFWLTLAGTLTIGSIIIITISALIVLRWTLGVAESILISLTIGLSIDFALHYSVAFSESKSSGANNAVIMKILEDVGSPIALATVTTFLAGFVIVWSDILAYQELGVFLMLISFISWASATFFLLPMLSTVSSLVDYSNSLSKDLARRAIEIILRRL